MGLIEQMLRAGIAATDAHDPKRYHQRDALLNPRYVGAAQ